MSSTYELIVQATDKTSGPLRKVENSLKGVEKQVKGVNSALKAAGGAVLAFATGSALRGIVNQYTAFERYRTVLATYLGSQEKANAALKDLQKLANNLPQDLDDITQAFVTLNRFGIDTSAKSLTAFSNIATANGKSLTQLAEAVADGMAGEYERFKEFGIKVTNDSGKLTAAIGKDIVATATNSTDLIEQLKRLGETRFGDAAANNADTLGQSLSNLKGAISEAVIAFAEGLAPALKQIADQTAAYVRANDELISQLGVGVGEALRTVASAAQFLITNMDLLTAVFKTFITLKILQFFGELTGRMIRYTNGAKTAAGVTSGLTKAIRASGAAAAVAIGQFTGLSSLFALLATRAGAAATGVGLFLLSTSLNVGELEDPIFTTTNAINEAVNAMKNFAGTGEELDALITQYEAVVQNAKEIAAQQDLTNSNGEYVYSNLTNLVMEYNGALFTARQGIKDTNEAQNTAVTGLSDYNQRMQELLKTVEDNLATKKFEKEALEQLTQEYKDGYLSLEKYEEAKALLVKTTEKAAKADKVELTALQQLIKSRKEDIDLTNDIQRALIGETKLVSELANEYGVSEAEVRKALEGRLATLVEVEDKTFQLADSSVDAAKKMTDAFKSAGDSLSSSLARGLAQGKYHLNDFKGFFNQFLEDILAAIIQKNLTDPLIKGLVGGEGGGGLLGDLLSLGSSFIPGLGGSGGGIVNTALSFAKKIPIIGGLFADGGIPPLGKPSIVGEKGPELFMPGTLGRVVPNDQLNMGGGQPVVVNFNINAIDTQKGVEFIVEQRDTITAIISDSLNKRGRVGITG